MRNSPRHGPRNVFRGQRRHHGGQGRRHHRHRSGHPEAERQGPPQPREARQHRPAQRARRNRRRSQQANFTQHHPMRELYALYNRMGHVFDRTFISREGRRRKGRSNWHPSVDFSEADDKFVVFVELPGVSQNDVNVSVTDNLLTVKGKKHQKQADETQNRRRSERRDGTFHRIFPLPPKVEVDSIKAEFKDGLLTLTVPKTEEAKPTEIPINVDA